LRIKVIFESNARAYNFALLRYLAMSVLLQNVGKEEGLFTFRAKHVVSRISVR